MQRRFLHCTRCLRTNAIKDINLPIPSVPEPINPPNPSIQETPRVSLSIDSMRKVPSRSWSRPADQTRGLVGAKSKNPLAEEQLQKEGKEPRLFKDGAKEKLQAQLRAGRYVLPPKPAPHAVHCVIEKIPRTLLSSDVARLVAFDPTKHTEHPIKAATRLYENNLRPSSTFLLTFTHPAALQDFLEELPKIKLFGQPLTAKLFYADIDESDVRPGTVLTKGKTPSNFLRHRDQYFRDATGKATLVMVEGIPKMETLGSISYLMLVLLENEKFDWAYKWANQPGSGVEFESNAVPIGTGAGYGRISRTCRWAFMLKDRESAWRFARKMHLKYYREDYHGTNFMMKATVME